MFWGIKFLIIIVVMFVFMFLGNWIAFSLGLAGIIGLLIDAGTKYLGVLGNIVWTTTNSATLTAIPLFIFMGELLIHSGISNKFYLSATKWLGRVPGSILQTNIISCAVFAAISGSSPATAAAIGSIAYPEMTKQGYDKSMIIGTIGGGGALGILIPPSIPMIIYASVAEVSIQRLFMAGVVPGLVAAGIFMIYVAIMNLLYKDKFPEKPDKVPMKEKLKAVKGMLPLVSLIVVVLGTIYLGITTATEAAALGTLIALFISWKTKTLTLENLTITMKSTIKTTSMILMIVIGAQILSFFIVMSGISASLTKAIVSTNLTVPLFLLIISIMYFILGCFLEATSMIYLTIPLLMPIINTLGIDLIWFGVIVTIFMEVAQITPPVGLNLYVLHGICNNYHTTSFGEVVKGIIPYVFMYILVAVLVMLIPSLALWLPSTII